MKYTDEQLEYLKKISKGRSNREITKMFNKKFNQKRTEGAIESLRGRKGFKNGLDGRLKKGVIPWNKGTKGICKPNSGSFQKGSIPHNHDKVGTVRIEFGGYHEIKVAEPDLWRPYHQVIWEEYHGKKLKEGEVIIFLDQNKDNLDINNLCMVTRKDLLRINRNKRLTKNKELNKVAINTSKIENRLYELESD